jgi:hypothetical protein
MKNLEQVIEQTKGKFFTVTFVKKDGTERVLNGRVGVVKHLKGGVNRVGDQYITVFDIKNGGYRSVNKSTIKEVKFGKEIYK